jgi:CO/xanthine dehydrogenase FAD-binding subunit
MSVQEYINILTGLVVFLAVYWFNYLNKTGKELQARQSSLEEKARVLELVLAQHYIRRDEVEKALDNLADKVGRIESIEVLLAGHYVSKEDFTRALDALLKKLDKIDEKLDNKVDKQR